MISKIIDEEIIRKIDKVLQKCNRFVLIGHESPDGDALGSTLGMAHFLRSCGKEEVRVMMPNAVPVNLRWLPGVESILVYDDEPEVCQQLLNETDVILFLDMNTLRRTGGMKDCFSNLMAYTILIDHHENPETFTQLTISHPDMSSTSELVFRYICRVGQLETMTLDSATCIYTGMMTDTGGFSYNSNSKDIYIIIHQLLQKGIDKDEIYRKVNYHFSLGRMRFIGYMLSRAMDVLPEYGTAITTISKRKLLSFQLEPGETEGFVNMPLSIKGVNLSILLREDKVIRISFRSVGKIHVNEMAEELGGGGHKNAAGARFNGSMKEAVARIKEMLPRYLSTKEASNEE